ncbi:MAG TPA: class I SAM-dependent methyltransferase [Thermomicrobiales bacterium]|nr:class I SAM-dependent methyltransferase [Thermomicrobiales bacterium]
MIDTTSTYTWSNSNAYEAFMGRWSSPLAEAAVASLALPPDLRWLDVGCGTGATTQAILTVADPREMTGIDPSADFLAAAAKRVRDSRVRFECGTIQSLPIPDGDYDAVISGLVLLFLPDPLAGVVEMARAARDGGMVSAYLWDVDGEDQFTLYFRKAATDLDPTAFIWDTSMNRALCRPEPLRALFEDAGLANVSVDEIVIPTVFDDFDDYWLPCLLDGPTPVQRYARSLTTDRQTVLREHLRSMLPIAADGTVPLYGHAWMVRGTK